MSKDTKYTLMMVERIKTTFDNWSSRDSILEKEIYYFLHNIKGTAGSIGLMSLSELAVEYIQYVSEQGEISFTTGQWQELLQPFSDWVVKESEKSKIELETAAPFLKDSEEVKDKICLAVQSNKTEIIEPGFNEPVRDDNKVVLLIDDDMDFVGYLIDRLEAEQYHVLIATNVNKGLELFYTMRPSFIMCNHELTKDEGDSAVQLLIQVARQTVTTIVFVGEKGTEQDRIQAYEIGATDYLVKPMKIEVFLPYLKNRLQWKQDVQQMITLDELTGVFNRKYMNDTLTRSMNDFRVNGRKFTIAIIDLDYFKQVNDTYGHLVGDKVLKGLVSVLNKTVRKADEIFRFGGEEFVIIFPDTDEQSAYQIMTAARIEFSEEVFFTEAETFSVTFSAGLKQVDSKIDSKEKLMDYADRALYLSKAGGRNMVTVHNQAESIEFVRKLRVMIVDDDKLVRAILERGFKEWEPDRDVQVIVEVFKDGVEFLNSDWYNSKDQFIVLLDGMMPRMDGLEVVEQLRAHYPEKNIIVTMLSARSDERNIVQALEHGADDYLLKPFNLAEVIARMDRLTNRMLF